MKKDAFKSIVKKQIRSLTMHYLVTLRSKHSKSEHLLIENGLKDYLKNSEITLEEKKLLFTMKTRTVNVKTSFRNSYSNFDMQTVYTTW